jgi:hypothetical protein
MANQQLQGMHSQSTTPPSCSNPPRHQTTLRCPSAPNGQTHPPRTQCGGRMNDGLVTNACGARDDLVFVPLTARSRGGHLQAGGVSPLSLPTFFAAAKKVGAAPHRGNTNKPIRMQGKANTISKQSTPPAKQKNHLATGIVNSAPLPILSGHLCMMLLYLV